MSRRAWMIVVAAVAGAFVIWLTATAFAQDNPSPSAKPSRTITVTSTATATAAPNEAVIELGVRSESIDGTAAFAQNAKDMQAVLDGVKATGVDEKDIQTTNVSLEQRVTNRGKPNEQQVFVATNSIRVTIHDLSSVGSVIDAAVRAGADAVNDIRFQLSDPNAVRTDALTRAVAGARAKADALASAADAEVVRVVTIDEQNYRPPVYEAALAAGALATPAATPIVPPSSLEVTETISVVWEIA
ncbi:MAG: SIMPL domain-containing protein [Actinomycetota bacterium]